MFMKRNVQFTILLDTNFLTVADVGYCWRESAQPPLGHSSVCVTPLYGCVAPIMVSVILSPLLFSATDGQCHCCSPDDGPLVPDTWYLVKEAFILDL